MTTDAPDDGDWLTSLFDIQSESFKRAVNEANRLRRRVRELELQLASGTAAELTNLQDRVTMLETLLAASKAEAAALRTRLLRHSEGKEE